MVSHLMMVMMVMMVMEVSPSLADPVPAAEDPSISPAGIELSDPRIKRSPDWNPGSAGIGWLLNLGGTELPPTTLNLVEAVEEGNLESVKDLIARGADVNGQHGVSLSQAGEHGRLEIAKYLLEAGANPNGDDEPHLMGWPLRKAAEYNHLDIVNLLLDSGASVEMEQHGVRVLDGAAENGHLEVVKRLIEAGADPDFGQGYSLLLAAKNGHLDIVNSFIEDGANVSAGGGWIMSSAAKKGHLQVVKALMKAGANTDDYGSAMASAADNGHLDIVNLMLENGVDPNYSNVLTDAAEYGDLEVVRTLLEAGSTITYDDKTGSALHYAVLKGHPEVVALLVEYGADINRALAKDIWYDIFTSISEEYGNGWTVMHVAARFGQPIIEKLIALGADINLQDVKGRTPLQVAVIYQKLITAKEMLRFCANLSPTNDEGMTALDMANVVASKYASNTTEYEELMKILPEVMPEKMVLSPDNEQTVRALIKEFQDIIKANSTLKSQLKIEDILYSDILSAIRYIFEDRARKNVVKTIEDHKCNLSLQDNNSIDFGTEYLARCECVPGQGPKLTLTLTQDGNLCDQREAV